jgi:formyltetrahydrofolate synthetase
MTLQQAVEIQRQAIILSDAAQQLEDIRQAGFGPIAVCVAKTAYEPGECPSDERYSVPVRSDWLAARIRRAIVEALEGTIEKSHATILRLLEATDGDEKEDHEA